MYVIFQVEYSNLFTKGDGNSLLSSNAILKFLTIVVDKGYMKHLVSILGSLWFLVFLGGCATIKHHNFYRFELLSAIGGKLKFKIERTQRYCIPTKISRNKHGFITHKIDDYPDYCGNGHRRIYKTYKLAERDLFEVAKNTCAKASRKAKFMGFEKTKEYSGATGSSCYGSGTYSEYSNSVSTSSYCSGSKAIYDYSTTLYFQCSDQNNMQQKESGHP